MGFTGMTINDSDEAADLAYAVGRQIAKTLSTELKAEYSSYNTERISTSGDQNIGMFFKEVIIPSKVFQYHGELLKLAERTLKSLKGKGWFKNKDRNTAFDRDMREITKALEKYLKD